MQPINVIGLSYDHRLDPVINHEIVAKTEIKVTKNTCPKCGQDTLETHTIQRLDIHQNKYVTGMVTKCSNCDRKSWMFESQMPRAAAARKLYEEKYKI